MLPSMRLHFFGYIIYQVFYRFSVGLHIGNNYFHAKPLFVCLGHMLEWFYVTKTIKKS